MDDDFSGEAGSRRALAIAQRLMQAAKVGVLIVEDEAIVAQDIRCQLEQRGYRVVGVAGTAEEAVRIATDEHPDLVLMDIRLNGETDGIKAAATIRNRFDVPVIFLTAYADEATLERAKVTEPDGYLMKPFEGKELQMVVEIASRKHRKGRELMERVATTLRRINDAVVAVDSAGRVTSINPAAERLTGWMRGQALGKDVSEVVRISTQHD